MNIKTYFTGDKLPRYETEDAAGMDIRTTSKEDFILRSGESTLIKTGIFMNIPKGYEIQVRPRSGLALKHQITVLNAPGTIDADYTGEIGVILINHGKKDYTIEPNERIAQLVCAPFIQANLIQVESKDQLTLTKRGERGFGSSGKK